MRRNISNSVSRALRRSAHRARHSARHQGTRASHQCPGRVTSSRTCDRRHPSAAPSTSALGWTPPTPSGSAPNQCSQPSGYGCLHFHSICLEWQPAVARPDLLRILHIASNYTQLCAILQPQLACCCVRYVTRWRHRMPTNLSHTEVPTEGRLPKKFLRARRTTESNVHPLPVKGDANPYPPHAPALVKERFVALVAERLRPPITSRFLHTATRPPLGRPLALFNLQEILLHTPPPPPPPPLPPPPPPPPPIRLCIPPMLPPPPPGSAPRGFLKNLSRRLWRLWLLSSAALARSPLATTCNRSLHTPPSMNSTVPLVPRCSGTTRMSATARARPDDRHKKLHSGVERRLGDLNNLRQKCGRNEDLAQQRRQLVHAQR